MDFVAAESLKNEPAPKARGKVASHEAWLEVAKITGAVQTRARSAGVSFQLREAMMVSRLSAFPSARPSARPAALALASCCAIAASKLSYPRR
jgi:hypothetical protein